MTLDERYVSTADAVRGAEADAARAAWQDYLLEREIESVEGEEARWSHRMRQADAEREPVVYRDGPDRRLFAVDGDLHRDTA